MVDEGAADESSAPRNDLPVRPAETRPGLDDRDKKVALIIEKRLEQRFMAIFRQESGDSYAGLPADHVLLNLDRAFPAVNFPERMLARLEAEQAGRLAHEQRQDELERYEAETRRLDAAAERNLLGTAATRAAVVLALLVAVGVLLTLRGHDTVGGIVLGATLVSVVTAFLRQQFKGKG